MRCNISATLFTFLLSNASQQILVRAYCVSCDLRRLSVLLHEADEHLFHKMVYNKDHCIHQLLPPEKIVPMKLRATNCIFALPQCHYNLYKRSFVLRYLFGDAYQILYVDLL